MSNRNPRVFRCSTCNAAPGYPCVRPTGDPLPPHLFPEGFHAPRRRLAGLTDGPPHPDRYIRLGTYQHGQGPSACGERITLDHCANARASDGTPVSWKEKPCPSFASKKRVQISDLGPIESLDTAPQPSLFADLPADKQ